jgi:hypothetical protein
MNTAYVNYRSIIDSATPEHIAQANGWYSEAQDIAKSMSNLSGLSIEKCASILAAFSPRERWTTNVKYANMFIQGGQPPALTNNINMAYAAMVHGFDALNGLKTNSFARNIAGDMDAVTIDTWMVKAAGMDNRKGVNNSQYRILTEIVRDLAVDYRMAPAHLQALIWIIVRGSHN